MLSIIFIVVVFLTVFKPSITVTVTGNHNPVNNYLFLNEKRIFPDGVGGTKYTSKLKAGNNNLELRGPLINTEKLKIDAGLVGGTQLKELASTTRNTEDIVKETYNNPSATFKKSQYFDETSTIVAYAYENDSEGNSGVVVFQYNQKNGDWENITDGFLKNQSNYNIGDSAVKYLGGFDD